MPLIKQPNRLTEICIESVIDTIDSYWLSETSQLKIHLNKNMVPLYLIGPFEALNDERVEFILKSIYSKSKLHKHHMIILLHNRLKKLDLSFIKKHVLISSSVVKHIGNNLFNLVELNLFSQTDLSPKHLICIISNMKRLKKINLSHTKTNDEVIKELINKCTMLEHINLENCLNVYEDCIEWLSNKFWQTLITLNIENINVSDEIIENVLKKSIYLKNLSTSRLVHAIKRIHSSNEYETSNDKYLALNLETVSIDSSTNLKQKEMESIALSCNKLKSLHISCIGSSNSFFYLNCFPYLNDLLIANTNSLISFQFGTYLLDALKTSIGKQLRSLSLIYLVDVNLRSISVYCPNLVKLHVEFLGYYEPANDLGINKDEEHTEQNNSQLQSKPLKHLYISNLSNKYEQIHLNIGQFKKDLLYLAFNTRLNHFELENLNELDDQFFQCLFSLPTLNPINNHVHISDSIETIVLNKMNGISTGLIMNYLIKVKHSLLKNLSLHECKLISKRDYHSMLSLAQIHNLDLNIIWS